MNSIAVTKLRPPRQVLSKDGGDLLSRTIASHPVGSLTLIGTALGGVWGGAAGMVLGSTAAKIGAGIGGVLLGARGYNIGKDLESWLKSAE